MCDPTFAHQFAMATQADILRQTARDQQYWQDRSLDDTRRTVRLITSARRLAQVLWAYLRPTDLASSVTDLPENQPQPAPQPGHQAPSP